MSKSKEEIIAGMTNEQKRGLRAYEAYPEMARRRKKAGLPVWDDVKHEFEEGDTISPAHLGVPSERVTATEVATFGAPKVTGDKELL